MCDSSQKAMRCGAPEKFGFAHFFTIVAPCIIHFYIIDFKRAKTNWLYHWLQTNWITLLHSILHRKRTTGPKYVRDVNLQGLGLFCLLSLSVFAIEAQWYCLPFGACLSSCPIWCECQAAIVDDLDLLWILKLGHWSIGPATIEKNADVKSEMQYFHKIYYQHRTGP